MRGLSPYFRRWQIRALGKVDPQTLGRLGLKQLARQARHVARRVPAYTHILAEQGIDANALRTPADVLERCPILGKADLFGRFALHELCVDGNLAPLGNVLTSSGQSGRFAFGLSTAAQARATTRAVDLGLSYAFETDAHRTLLINALPMGVRFSATSVTIAETSVREDMVAALMREVAPYFEQTILVLDPLFCKRLLDHASDTGFDWRSTRVHVILGEETFGEHFRGYVAARMGLDPTDWSRGFIGSSMGVGEVGLNLFFETRETVALRRLAQAHPAELADVIGPWPGQTPPLLFVYDPRRLFVEITRPDDSGFGALTVSTLDRGLMLPVLRYATGDRARLLDHRTLVERLRSCGFASQALPALPMIALAGREQDQLPDGRALLDFKDALYANAAIADQLSGAFRVECEASTCRLHLQTRKDWHGGDHAMIGQILDLLPRSKQGIEDRIQVWEHADFPFGRTLDYERKFSYLSHEWHQADIQ